MIVIFFFTMHCLSFRVFFKRLHQNIPNFQKCSGSEVLEKGLLSKDWDLSLPFPSPLVCSFLNIKSNTSLAGSRICYGNLGCFDTGPPFWSLRRPLSVLPQRPEKINTRFFLFTRSNVNTKQQLIYKDKRSIKSSSFLGRKKTKIVCHGFTENGLIDWMKVH